MTQAWVDPTADPDGSDRNGTIDAASLGPASLSIRNERRFHAVSDQELAMLTRIKHPVPIVVAAVFTGIFLATFYQAWGAIEAAAVGAPIGVHLLIYVIANAASFGIAIAAGVVAARGRSEIAKAPKAVQERAQMALPSGHPMAPPH